MRRTLTRMPSSSIVISPTPVSWTIRTTSRIRSWRTWSTPPAASGSSPPERPRIARSSGSASSPKSASSNSSSSLAASPPASSRRASRSIGGSGSAPKFSTARIRAASTGPGRAAEPARHEVAQLVDHRRVPVRGQDVEEGLRGDDLPDRRGERRRTDLFAHPADLVDHLVQAVARGLRSQLHVERRDEADRKLVLRGANGDARRERRDGLVADVLVDEVRGIPQLLHVDPGLEADPGERLRDRLGRDAVHRQRDRVDGRRDHVRAGARCFEGRSERVAAGALGVEPDRQPRDLAQLGDELARAVRLQDRGRVVQQQARGTELRQALRRVDERFVAAAAVEDARLELLARLDDRLGRLAQVVDVVQRVVQTEDVDAALGGARDEATGEIAADGARADEEPAAEGERQRRLRPALQRADALPRALDAAAHGAVEHAAAGDLEVGEPGLVEDLRKPEDVGRRHASGERLLAENANRRVDKARHAGGDLTACLSQPRPLRTCGARLRARSTAQVSSSCSADSVATCRSAILFGKNASRSFASSSLATRSRSR